MNLLNIRINKILLNILFNISSVSDNFLNSFLKFISILQLQKVVLSNRSALFSLLSFFSG